MTTACFKLNFYKKIVLERIVPFCRITKDFRFMISDLRIIFLSKGETYRMKYIYTAENLSKM